MTATRRVKAARSAAPAGFILVELLAMLTIIVFVLIATTRMLMTQIELQQVERQHQNRVAAMDSLVRRLRGDLLAATGWRWSAAEAVGAAAGSQPASSGSEPASSGSEPASSRWQPAPSGSDGPAELLGVLSLDVLDADVVRVVEYAVEAERVRRTVRGTDDASQTDAWSSHRLRFDAALEPGPRGATLRLSFIETPPPRRRRLPDRTYTTVLALPAPSSSTEDRP